MKLLLDIKESKADFILELLKGFPSYVKTEHVSPTKAEISLAASKSKLHKQGKIKIEALEFSKTSSIAKKDWWDDLTESQQKAVEESIAEMKTGKLTPHADVMKKYKKWTKK